MKLDRISSLLRLNEWYYTLLVLFLAVTLCFGLRAAKELTLFFLIMIFCAMFGFLLNSYTDRNEDKLVRKVNIYYFSKRTIILILISLAVIIITLSLMSDGYYLYIFYLILIFTYSYLKFKNLGMFGLISIILIMLPIPFLILALVYYFALESISGLRTGIFLLYLIIYSLNTEFIHQVRDYKNDKKTQIKTFVVRLGHRKSIRLQKFFRFMLPCATLPFLALKDGAVYFILFNLVNVHQLYYIHDTLKWIKLKGTKPHLAL